MNKFISFLLIISCYQASSQITHNSVIALCDSMFQLGVEEQHVPGGIVSIVSGDSILFSQGYGYSNYEEKIPVHPSTTLFQLGSIGKVFTAISVLQQADDNKINLNDDVNKYLKDWKIKNKYNEKINIFHLLTHTAGLNDRLVGYLAKSEDNIQRLEDHLSDNMPSTFQPAGIDINYSNYGYALAGFITEKVSNETFSQYIENNIFQSLEMSSSTYLLPGDYQQRPHYAKGYHNRDTFVELKSYPRHPIPAGSLLSTADDMASFMQALLRRDSILLDTETYDLLLNQQFSNHPKLSGYSCGLEVQNWGNLNIVGKAGTVPGFLSVFLLFTDLDLGLFVAVNTETDNFIENFFREFKKQFIPKRSLSVPLDKGFDLDQYTGDYGNLRNAHHTIEEMFLLFMGHFKIYASDSSMLTSYHNGGWQKYRSIENDVFQNIDSPDQYLVFKRNNKGKINRLYRSVMVGGIEIPCSYRKLNWLERPAFLNDEYPFVLLFIATYLLIPIFWILVYLINFHPSVNFSIKRISAQYHIAAFVFLMLFFWSIIGFFIPLIQLQEEILFGLPPGMLKMKYVHYAMAIVSLFCLFFSLQMWMKKEGTLMMRIYYTLYSLATLSFILMLQRWHFLHISI